MMHRGTFCPHKNPSRAAPGEIEEREYVMDIEEDDDYCYYCAHEHSGETSSIPSIPAEGCSDYDTYVEEADNE